MNNQEWLYEAARQISLNCSIEDCEECIFYDEYDGCRIDNGPLSWNLPEI